MDHRRDAPDLVERFDALRHEDRTGPPRFPDAKLAAAARRRRASLRRRLVGTLAAAAAATVLVLVGLDRATGPARGSTIDLATTRWVAPTDFLLATPGSELLRTVPTFGRRPAGDEARPGNSNSGRNP